jgi:hypothetical protein
MLNLTPEGRFGRTKKGSSVACVLEDGGGNLDSLVLHRAVGLGRMVGDEQGAFLA